MRQAKSAAKSDSEASTSAATTSKRSNTSSTLPSLKTKFTGEDMEGFKEMFKQLDHKEFWYLDATKAAAERDGVEAESVEEKMANFALKCNHLQ